MNTVQMWFLGIVITCIGTVMGFVIKFVTSQVIKRLDAIVEKLENLGSVTTSHKEQLQFHKERIDDLHERMRSLEMK
jgi:uncharacterized membrane-anchored protein YhcB (DUF1043 family)